MMAPRCTRRDWLWRDFNNGKI